LLRSSRQHRFCMSVEDHDTALLQTPNLTLCVINSTKREDAYPKYVVLAG
jgi:hypothetical protein